MEIEPYMEKAITWLLSNGLRIIFILVLMIISLIISHIISNRLRILFYGKKDEEFKKRADTLSSIIRYILSIGVIIVAAVMILGELGIAIGPILAAVGVLGLAVGFGAQNLVQDVISGFFLLLEDQIRVGDVVDIAGKAGLVEKVTLRMIILRDLAGNVHYVRNGHINVVTNMTKDYSRYVFDIGVSYREDVDEVIEVIQQVDEELRGDPEFSTDILEPIEILGLDQFTDSAIIIKARTKTKPIKQWRIAREFNRRLKKKFNERNIEIPFPHVTLYMGENKQGQAAPLNVAVKRSNAGTD